MKKYTLIIFFAINVIAYNATAQDTTKYLKENIISSKEKYEKKPLSVLLKDLHLDVRSYFYSRSAKPGGPIKEISLLFESYNAVSQKLESRKYVNTIIVDFENTIPRNIVSELFDKSHGAWLEGEKNFYGQQTVKSIRIMRTQ